jgi:uncharacterized membrane protein
MTTSFNFMLVIFILSLIFVLINFKLRSRHKVNRVTSIFLSLFIFCQTILIGSFTYKFDSTFLLIVLLTTCLLCIVIPSIYTIRSERNGVTRKK